MLFSFILFLILCNNWRIRDFIEVTFFTNQFWWPILRLQRDDWIRIDGYVPKFFTEVDVVTYPSSSSPIPPEGLLWRFSVFTPYKDPTWRLFNDFLYIFEVFGPYICPGTGVHKIILYFRLELISIGLWLSRVSVGGMIVMG